MLLLPSPGQIQYVLAYSAFVFTYAHTILTSEFADLHFQGGERKKGSKTYIDHRTTLDVALSHPDGNDGERSGESSRGSATTATGSLEAAKVHKAKSMNKRRKTGRGADSSRASNKGEKAQQQEDEGGKVQEGLIYMAVPLCPSVPTNCLRAILTWDTDAVLDLHVFCFDGNNELVSHVWGRNTKGDGGKVHLEKPDGDPVSLVLEYQEDRRYVFAVYCREKSESNERCSAPGDMMRTGAVGIGSGGEGGGGGGCLRRCSGLVSSGTILN